MIAGWQVPAALGVAFVLAMSAYLIERTAHEGTSQQLELTKGKVTELRADVDQSRLAVAEAERINASLSAALRDSNRRMADLARQQRELEEAAEQSRAALSAAVKQRQEQAAQRRRQEKAPAHEYMAEIVARALGAK